jgi:DNA (cytosine-5)-methyltransferase 1
MNGKLRVLDLFSGIGGFSLGLERAGGFETVAFCEIDKRCQAILGKHWPNVPCYDDVRTLGRIDADVITAGFPCQDISKAGKRAGLSGERSGLFWEVVRAIRLVRPKYAILENVADLLHGGMGDVCGALASSGLRVEWDCVSARDLGAPHYRDRIWIVAHADAREQPNGSVPSIRRGGKGKGKGKGIRRTANANANGEGELQPGWCFAHVWRRPFHGGSNFVEWRDHWRDRLGALCRMDDGVSRRLDEARPLGNTLLPDCPELIGKAIMQAEGMSP